MHVELESPGNLTCTTTKADMGTVVKKVRTAEKQWLEVKTIAQNRVRWPHFVDALCYLVELDTDDDDIFENRLLYTLSKNITVTEVNNL